MNEQKYAATEYGKISFNLLMNKDVQEHGTASIFKTEITHTLNL